jgi:hypothetical protein
MTTVSINYVSKNPLKYSHLQNNDVDMYDDSYPNLLTSGDDASEV